jgi:hypothetical protein
MMIMKLPTLCGLVMNPLLVIVTAIVSSTHPAGADDNHLALVPDRGGLVFFPRRGQPVIAISTNED